MNLSAPLRAMKKVWFTNSFLGDRHHIFTERVGSQKKSEVLLQQFSAIDTTFLTRGLGTSRCNLRFATVLTIDNTFLAKRLISGWPFNTQGHSMRIHSMRIHLPVCIRNCNVCECQKHILAYRCISRNGEEYEYHCMSFHTIATRREWQ